MEKYWNNGILIHIRPIVEWGVDERGSVLHELLIFGLKIMILTWEETCEWNEMLLLGEIGRDRLDLRYRRLQFPVLFDEHPGLMDITAMLCM